MKRFSFVGFLVFMAFTCISVGLSAQTKHTYLLRSDGSVKVNGVVVPGSAVVSTGDLVETDKASAAKLTTPGMAMLVGENSRVTVASDKLAVDYGTASVSTTNGMATRASQYSVSPAGAQTAKYQIVNTGTSLSVTSSVGRLTVNSILSAPTEIAVGEQVVVSSGAATSNYVGMTLPSGSVGGFTQLTGVGASGICKNAQGCPCKNTKQCPH